MTSAVSDAAVPAAVPRASIVIPAHDEERVLGRLLAALTSDGGTPFEIVVVCNGCSDATADVARAAGSDVVVVELEQPSKHAALRAGNAVASTFPRLFLDADVEIDAAGVSRLVAALESSARLLAVGPARRVPTDRSSWPVRAYYDVWAELPAVRSGLFGRGVIAVSREGYERLGEIPEMMGDDLVISDAFARHERAVVLDAAVTIHPPRTVRDLHRRRVRAATGNRQANAAGLRQPTSSVSLRDLVHLVGDQPRLMLRLPVFLAISAAGRWGAQRAVRAGDYSTWERDVSSRDVDVQHVGARSAARRVSTTRSCS